MIEKLQLSIKQSEAVVESLQTQLSLITKTRDDLADELYKVSMQNEDLKASNRELEALKKEKKSLQDKLMACAELIGEREETILELKADITEMRQVYQSQVEELCSKIKER
jgi:chromosome segregation ATPase